MIWRVSPCALAMTGWARRRVILSAEGLDYAGHSHAAPRTPLESPCIGGSSLVTMRSGSEKT